MSRIPEDLRYSPTYQWARREADGTVAVGITDHAQAELGDIVYVELPKVGATVKVGQPCMVIESVKAASDVHAPVSGEVAAVNETVAERPECLNEDPYAHWLFRVRPSEPAEWETLLDADGYRRLLGED